MLARLASAAARHGRMPHQDPTPAAIYQALHDTLGQMGLRGDAAETSAAASAG